MSLLCFPKMENRKPEIYISLQLIIKITATARSRGILAVSLAARKYQHIKIENMLIKTFWKILIKIIGLWLLFSCVSIIPQFFSTLSFTNGDLNTESLMLLWLMLFGSIIIYILTLDYSFLKLIGLSKS